jgi:RNA polymerase primary sigma factor
MSTTTGLKPRKASILGAYIQHLESAGAERLSMEQECELASSVAMGDCEALDKLVQANAKLVIHIASQFVGRGLDLDDLVGEGNLGLIRASKDFNPSFGTRFSTYASYWIKQSIRLALTNTAAVIRLPSHMVVLLQQWSKIRRKLESEMGREASFDEIATQMELSETMREHVRKAMTARNLAIESTTSGDRRADPLDDPANRVHESPESRMVVEEEQLWLHRRMTRLNDRERVVIALRYGLHGENSLTWIEIGERLGVTREWARKIELKALEKLRSEADPFVKPDTDSKKDLAAMVQKPPGGSSSIRIDKTPRRPYHGTMMAQVMLTGVQ